MAQLHSNSNSVCIVCGSNLWHNVPSVTQVIRSLFESSGVIRCEGCGLGRLEPMPTRDAVHAIYSSESYAQSYEAAGQDFVVSESTAKEHFATRFARLASYLPAKGRLLDIGASRGVFLNLAKLEGWTIFGLEAGLDTIEYAKSHFGITIQHGTLEETALPSGFYDCVHLSHVLEHLHDPLVSIRTIASAMRTGGVLTIEVPFEFGDLFDTFREKILRRPRAKNTVPSSHLYFFTLKSLCRLLEKAGLEVLHAATPRRNQSLDSSLPMGKLFKRSVYHLEKVLKMGPLIEVYAGKK